MWSKFWLNSWWLYRDAMPHRSMWSHGPIIGTAGRLIYLAALLSLLFFLLQCATWGAMHHTFEPMRYAQEIKGLWVDGLSRVTFEQMRAGFAAMEAGSMLHVAADLISTKMKRMGWVEGAHHK